MPYLPYASTDANLLTTRLCTIEMMLSQRSNTINTTNDFKIDSTQHILRLKDNFESLSTFPVFKVQYMIRVLSRYWLQTHSKRLAGLQIIFGTSLHKSETFLVRAPRVFCQGLRSSVLSLGLILPRHGARVPLLAAHQDQGIHILCYRST